MKENNVLIPANMDEMKILLQGERNDNKKEWPAEARLNLNVKRVVWSEKEGCYVHLCFTDSNYIKFMDEYMKSKVGNEYLHACMYYDEIIHVPENLKDKMYKIKMFTDNLIKFKFDDCELMFVPYNKGVMLLSIKVNEDSRGKGIGTNVIDELYELSDKLNIPLYLQPYPDEYGMQTDKIWPEIHRLRKWYDRLGFGPVLEEGSWVWSNFTDECIKELFVEDYIEKSKRAYKISKK